MRSSVIAIVLCLFAAGASAQCVAQANVTPSAARPGAELVMTSTGGPRASTHSEQALPVDDGVPALHEATPAHNTPDKQPRRTDSAMLLAAVALMSGIVLRRCTAQF